MHRARTILAAALVAVGILAAPGPAAAQPARVHAAVLDSLPRLHDRPSNVAQTEAQNQQVMQGVQAEQAVYPLAGEGMIRVTTRVCGTAETWQANAAANNVVPPVYLVLLGQRYTISCSAISPPSTMAQPAAPPTASAAGWANPLPGACIVSAFGVWRGTYAHQGVDLAAGYGTPIRAAAAGTVSVGWQSGGAGNYTMINHGGGVWTVSMHQSSFAVRSGWVVAGQTIGYVGATGDASGPHLHLEVHTGGLWAGRVNPVSFLADRGIRLGC